MLENPVYCGERDRVNKAQPAIISGRLWNAAQRARASALDWRRVDDR